MNTQPIRVLLLDDEESLRKPLTDYLQNVRGFIVDPAGTSSQALRLLEEKQGRYDVALIDEVLAEPPSGLEVVKEIKANYPDIEVILFTGWGMKTGIDALRAGVYRYLAKPFDKDELAMTIRFAAEYGQTRRERKILQVFQQVSTAISSTLDRNEILRRACQAAVELFGVEHSGLVEFAEGYENGKVVVEFPDKGTLGTVIQVRGVPPEERLVYQQEVLNIPDVAAEHSLGSVRDTLLRFGIQSILIVPVVLQDKVVASFSLDVMERKRTFYPNEIELCKSLANQVAVAINNARLYEETREGRDYLHSLYQATTEIISPREPKDVLQNIVETACRTTRAWRAAALLVGDSEHPRAIALYGFEKEIEATSIRREHGISNAVLQSGQPRFIPDTEAKRDQVNPAMLEQGVKAAACLPLPLTGKNIGVLWIHFRDKHTFSETEKQALQLYANQSAIAYDNARRMRELEQLRVAANAMASKAEWKDVLQEIAKSAKQVLEADYTLIWHYDAERRIFFPEDLVAEGIPDDLLEEFRKVEPETGKTTERVLEKRYVKVEDLSCEQPDFLGESTRDFLKRLKVIAFQGIRLDVAGEPLGVLYVDYKHARGFGEEDRRILEHFANHAALTLKKARLFEQVQRSRDAARAVAKVSTLGNLEETLIAIVNGARQALHCEIATLYTFDEDKQQFVRYAGVGYKDAKNMRPPAKITNDSALWKIMGLRDKTYHLSEDVLNDKLLKGRFAQAEGVRSALGIQLRFGEHRVGVMFINYRTAHRFTQDEIDDALLFANQAAVAIHNAQLHDKVSKRADVMKALYEAGKAITSTLSVDETLQRIAEQALRIVGVECQQEGCFSHIALLEGNKLRFIAGFPTEILTDLRQNVGEIDLEKDTQKGIVGEAVLERQSKNIPEVSTDPNWIPLREGINIHSQLSVLLKVGEHIIGVLSIEHPRPAAFSEEEVQNVDLLAAQAAVAIKNAQRFGETERILAARTALAWTGMLGSTWRHAVEKHAITIREQIQLLRSDLASKERTDTTNKRLEMIERLANQILEKPLTPPLSAEEGVHSLPINDFLRERAKQLWAHEQYKPVSLELDLKLDDTATVRASPEWLRRALDILIDNAVEATAELPERKIVIRSRQLDHCAEISITDNGRGIPPEVLEQLFRAPIKKPQGAKGQGIGLLLAQTIVQTYGGTIYCRETGATGTTMVISLPLEM